MSPTPTPSAWRHCAYINSRSWVWNPVSKPSRLQAAQHLRRVCWFFFFFLFSYQYVPPTFVHLMLSTSGTSTMSNCVKRCQWQGSWCVCVFSVQPPIERVIHAARHCRGPEEHPERVGHCCRPAHRFHPHQGRLSRQRGDAATPWFMCLVTSVTVCCRAETKEPASHVG